MTVGKWFDRCAPRGLTHPVCRADPQLLSVPTNPVPKSSTSVRFQPWKIQAPFWSNENTKLIRKLIYLSTDAIGVVTTGSLWVMSLQAANS